jgi:hypothetical protein
MSSGDETFPYLVTDEIAIQYVLFVCEKLGLQLCEE